MAELFDYYYDSNNKHGITFYKYMGEFDGKNNPFPVNDTDGTYKIGHSWDDFRLIPTARPSVEAPTIKESTQDITFGDGKIDLTDGNRHFPLYNNRTGSWTFVMPEYDSNYYDVTSWVDYYTNLLGCLNGRYVNLVLDDDPDHYYTGRLTISQFTSSNDGTVPGITINYDLKPYKYEKNISYINFSNAPGSPFPFYRINPGAIIKIKENGNDDFSNYILVKKTGSEVLLLRDNAVDIMKMQAANYDYYASNVFNYLVHQNEFRNKYLDAFTQSKLKKSYLNSSKAVYRMDEPESNSHYNNENKTYQDIYILDIGQLLGASCPLTYENYTGHFNDTDIITALKRAKNTTDENIARIATNDDGEPVSYWTSSNIKAQSGPWYVDPDKYCIIDSTGELSNSDTWDEHWVRPVLSLDLSTTVYGSGSEYYLIEKPADNSWIDITDYVGKNYPIIPYFKTDVELTDDEYIDISSSIELENGDVLLSSDFIYQKEYEVGSDDYIYLYSLLINKLYPKDCKVYIKMHFVFDEEKLVHITYAFIRGDL